MIDHRFRRRPGWIWIYSGLYYPVIILTVVATNSMRLFNYTAFSYLILLALQMLFFIFYPVAVPEDWRPLATPTSISDRFLQLVHRYDARSNCFPSMHVSVATLTAFHLRANTVFGSWSFLFPVLIGASAIMTKQHYLVDIPAGMLLGGFSYWLLRFIY
ncbi:MAG TPA: phosphatase PAP2 family protein [Thermoanaerobaculia bacterium]|nr:phosphatase PAP2 family protein [Thermoanaerobaculia bacterium]